MSAKNWPFDELRGLFNDLIFDTDLGQGLGNALYKKRAIFFAPF